MIYNQTMRSLKWSTSHAVFVTEIDDEHKEIFEALSSLQKALTSRGPVSELRKLTQRLVASILGHFAHEERLMRAARYGSLRWHKQQHDTASKRVSQFVLRIEQGDAAAGLELIDYLTSWLHNHTHLADRMMGAFLRNQRRCMWKVTFRAGTKPVDASDWLRANGERLDPQTGESRPDRQFKWLHGPGELAPSGVIIRWTVRFVVNPPRQHSCWAVQDSRRGDVRGLSQHLLVLRCSHGLRRILRRRALMRRWKGATSRGMHCVSRQTRRALGGNTITP